MITSRHIGKIVLAAVAAAVLLTTALYFGPSLGLVEAGRHPAYVSRLFDTDRVHRIDIVSDGWGDMLAEPEREEYHPATFVINGEKVTHAGIRIKGNSSLRLTQKYGHERFSLKVKFDHYVRGQTYYGLDEIALDASFQDNSYLKTHLVYDMMNHMGVAAPLTSFAWITVNGQAHGLYLIIEEPNEAFARRNFGPGYGQLYKPDYRSLQEENWDVWLVYRGGDPAQYDNIFRKARFKPDDDDKARLIESLRRLTEKDSLEQVIDVDQVTRYFAVHVFVVNLDGYLGRTAHNYYLYEKNGVLSMHPWDYNLAFATYSLGMPDPINDAKLYVNHPIFTPGDLEQIKNRPMFHHLMQNREHFARYRGQMDRLLSTYIESGRFEAYLSQAAALIAPFVEKDPTAFCSYADHLDAVRTLTDFVLLRADSVRGQLNGTIPGTWKGQRENPAALLDADHIWLPDMGEIADLKD